MCSHGDNSVEIDLGNDRFPAMFRDEEIEIDKVVLLAESREEISEGMTAVVDVNLPDDSTTRIPLGLSPTLEGAPRRFPR